MKGHKPTPNELEDIFRASEKIKEDYSPALIKLGQYETKDSGQREEFSTGSKRDTRVGKGRFDLIPVEPMKRLAGLYERGAIKYGDNNWAKGQPLSRYLDSAERHLYEVKEGLKDEDHAIAVCWNMFSFISTIERIEKGLLPRELDDINWLEEK